VVVHKGFGDDAGFGAWVEVPSLDWSDAGAVRAVRDAAVGAFKGQGAGVVVVRGLPLMEPETVVDVSRWFGAHVERNPGVDPAFLLPGWPEIQRLGNAMDPATGKPAAVFQASRMLPLDDPGTYDPVTRAPVWHTDQLFRVPQPRGSLLHCRAAPPVGSGARTLFASTEAAYASLAAAEKVRVDGLYAVASYAHHNAKIRRLSPLNASGFPVLGAEQRRNFPPVILPLASVHPDTGKRCLNCFSSAVFAVVDGDDPLLDIVRGAQAGDDRAFEALDAYEVDGREHPSVESVLRRWLLPHATAPDAVYAHPWHPGDIVVWDNLCTIHAPTGFDAKRYRREMWRTTFASEEPPRAQGSGAGMD